MCNFLVLLILLIGHSTHTQTSIIGLKIHHGDIRDIPTSNDYFGVAPPTRKIKTITKLDTDCIVQAGTETIHGGHHSHRFSDTICDHWYYKQVNYDTEKMQEFHLETIKFVGFENKSPASKKKNSPFFKKRNKRKKPRWLFLPLIFIAIGTTLIQTKK